MVQRVQWAKIHVNWSLEKWSKVLFTEESKFELFESKQRQYFRRFVGQHMAKQGILLIVKHGGGSVIVWGCFDGDKVGNLIGI